MKIKWLRDIGAALARDALGLGGFALVETGIAMIYRPAALIVGGATLIAAAWLLAKRG